MNIVSAAALHRRHAVAAALSALVASVWLYHGLVNKLLGMEPRHLLIVQSVPGLGGATGEVVLMIVGAAELLLAGWVLSGVRPLTCAAVQSVALLAMNVIELAFAREHLLWSAMLAPANIGLLALAWTAAILRADKKVTSGLLYRLRRHPLRVLAHFDDSLVLTYALPAKVLEPLLPPGLAVDTYDGYGFVAVAMVQTRDLRPALVPRVFGRNFFLTGYRVFAKFKTPDGRTIRGLRILRSDADSSLMVAAGNLLTHYNYRRCDATVDATPEKLVVVVRTPGAEADVEVSADLTGGEVLPASSPFRTMRDARRFAGPLPYTFDYESQTHSIVAIKGVRENWSPRLVNVDVRRLAFFDDARFRGVTPILASAFHVRDIPYSWLRGVRFPLDGGEQRGRFQGVVQIVRLNWPAYVIGLAVTLVAALGATAIFTMPAWLRWSILAGAAMAMFWLVASLLVSHVVYDRSRLRTWTWVREALGGTPRHWVNLHAGLDESTPVLRRLFPGSTNRVYDFFDAGEMTERSIRRARRVARNRIAAEKVDPRRLPLAGESIDAAFLLLSAHELRTRQSRVGLLKELRRSLKVGGKIILAEHVRGLPNFLAFGPGFLHFFSRREWRETAAAAGLEIEREFQVTPWIAVFVLGRPS